MCKLKRKHNRWNVVLKSTLSSSLVYHLPLRLPYYAFLSIRDKEEGDRWIHAFTNQWMYSIYTEMDQIYT